MFFLLLLAKKTSGFRVYLNMTSFHSLLHFRYITQLLCLLPISSQSVYSVLFRCTLCKMCFLLLMTKTNSLHTHTHAHTSCVHHKFFWRQLDNYHSATNGLMELFNPTRMAPIFVCQKQNEAIVLNM